MDIEAMIQLLDYILSSKRKRHITGGILMSLSLLFAGLAITSMTANSNDNKSDIGEKEVFL